jgi:replication fork clamp-binding protein CrfC
MLQEASLYQKLLNCESKMQQISFSRFIVTPEDIKLEPDSVCTIAKLLEPSCHCDIQLFLSFTHHYMYFISSLLLLAKAMTDILKKGNNGCFLGVFLPTPAMK